jgi:hypothetical protein
MEWVGWGAHANYKTSERQSNNKFIPKGSKQAIVFKEQYFAYIFLLVERKLHLWQILEMVQRIGK